MSGMPNPPSHQYKVGTLRDLGKAYGLNVFVESGTLYGDTVDFLSRHFDVCITIEVDPRLHALAVIRFAGKSFVRPVLGDSANVIPSLLAELDRPALFWLDGHYSGGVTGKGATDTPIRAELGAILEHQMEGHVVVIDDARLFDGTSDYPTLDELRAIVKRAWPNAIVRIERDMIRILPSSRGI
jgi:hypothetical protein